MPATDVDPVLAPLLAWLHAGGGESEPVTVVATAPGERGVFARHEVASGTALVRVPATHLISVERARASPVGRALLAAGISPEEISTYLAAFLLAERRALHSPWRPYLDTLPWAYPHAPPCWTERELAALEGSPVLARARARRALLVDELARLRRALPGFPAETIDEYLWARLAVDSRLFAFAAPDGRESHALVPLADMLNHGHEADAVWSFDREEPASFVVRALNDLPAGREVRTRYGRKSNARLLLTYGFALPDNPFDEAELDVPCAPPLARHALLLGAQVEDGRARFLPRARYQERATRALVTFLRLAHAAPGELARAEWFDGVVAPISLACERAAMNALATLAERRLARYPTSADEDVRALEAPALAPSARSALLVCLGEKRILAGLADHGRRAAALLATPRVLARRALTGHYDGGAPFDLHLREVALALCVAALGRA